MFRKNIKSLLLIAVSVMIVGIVLLPYPAGAENRSSSGNSTIMGEKPGIAPVPAPKQPTAKPKTTEDSEDQQVFEPKMAKLPKFTVVGIEVKTTMKDKKYTKDISDIWGRINREKLLDKVKNKRHPDTMLGIMVEYNEKQSSFTYIACAEVVSVKDLPAGMVARQIPASEYAVFTVKSRKPENIAKAWNYAMTKWLPQSGYKTPGTHQIEWYDSRFFRPKNVEMDIYLPVVKKPITNKDLKKKEKAK